MPVIRVSNETYQKLLELQAKDGNSMSIFMDRLVGKYLDCIEGESEGTRTRSKNTGESSKRAGRASKKESGKSGKLVEGLEDVYED